MERNLTGTLKGSAPPPHTGHNDDPFPEVDIVVLPMNSSTASAIEEEEELGGSEKGQMGRTLGCSGGLLKHFSFT